MNKYLLFSLVVSFSCAMQVSKISDDIKQEEKTALRNWLETNSFDPEAITAFKRFSLIMLRANDPQAVTFKPQTEAQKQLWNEMQLVATGKIRHGSFCLTNHTEQFLGT